MSQIDQEYRLL